MSENKCCGNSSSSYAKDMDSFCVRGFLHKFAVCDDTIDHHTRIINGWTEITPENMDEIKKIDVGRLSFAYVNKNGYVIYRLRMSLEFMARSGGYYYYVLPELKIE